MYLKPVCYILVSLFTSAQLSTTMAAGLIPYSVESLPENTERENEIFASKLIKSFESRSKQKGIFYITSLINFLLQLQRNALEERCQPLTTKV